MIQIPKVYCDKEGSEYKYARELILQHYLLPLPYISTTYYWTEVLMGVLAHLPHPLQKKKNSEVWIIFFLDFSFLSEMWGLLDPRIQNSNMASNVDRYIKVVRAHQSVNQDVEQTSKADNLGCYVARNSALSGLSTLVLPRSA